MNGLLVDDDQPFLRAMQRALRRHDIVVATATNIRDALLEARASLPDFALVDLKIGRESGLDLIQPLKGIRGDMRVVLVTGYASVATAVGAIKLGADDYLLKPVTVDVVLRALLDWLEGGPDQAQDEPTMTPLSRLEWEHIQQALSDTDGNISAAARLLGMHRRSLQRKLAKRPGPERAKNEPPE
jgi:two-component system, response regulator RegA